MVVVPQFKSNITSTEVGADSVITLLLTPTIVGKTLVNI